MGFIKWNSPEHGREVERINNEISGLLLILVLFIILGLTFCIAFGD